jgi:hypothetical protein
MFPFMKTSIRLVAFVCALGVLGVTAQGKPKHKATKSSQPEQKAPEPPADAPLSARLSRFFDSYLDKIFAPLDQPVALPRNELTKLRESLLDGVANASAADKPPYQASVAVCDALSQAMDEREKSRINSGASAGVHGSADLGARRKDNPGVIDYVRERHEEKNRKKEAADKDKFLNSGVKTQWSQRALQLRQNIDQLYSRVRAAERQSEQAKAAAAPAAAQ